MTGTESELLCRPYVSSRPPVPRHECRISLFTQSLRLHTVALRAKARGASYRPSKRQFPKGCKQVGPGPFAGEHLRRPFGGPNRRDGFAAAGCGRCTVWVRIPKTEGFFIHVVYRARLSTWNASPSVKSAGLELGTPALGPELLARVSVL